MTEGALWSGRDRPLGTSPPEYVFELERAHDHLREAAHLFEQSLNAAFDLRPAARLLEDAFVFVYFAYDDPEARLDAVRQALVAIDGTMSALDPAVNADAAAGFAREALVDARTLLAAAEGRIASIRAGAKLPIPGLRASRDVPALHAVQRPLLRPQIKVAPPSPEAPPPEVLALPLPRTFQELDAAIEAMKLRAEQRREARRESQKEPEAEGPAGKATTAGPRSGAPPLPGFVAELPARMAPSAFVAQRARECFEEVAMVGMQRAPLLGDPWRSTAFLEDRMLRCIDAIVALGPHALGQLEPWVRDAPAPDASRVFAMTMVLGCVEGRDALAAAERTFLFLEKSDPEVTAHFAGALKLAPHPQLPLALRTFLGGKEPAHRALAIDVLGYRGLATEDELARSAVDGDSEVVTAALPRLALTRREGVREAIDSALRREERAVREAAWRAMAVAGHSRTSAQLVEELAGPSIEAAALCLGIVGGARDAQRLLERARTSPLKGLVTAIGWAGKGDAIEPLIGFLELEDEAKVAAAYALHRITGAGLWETIPIEPEEILVPDVPEPDVGRQGGPKGPSLARLVSDPRDLPATGSPDSLVRPSTDSARWKAYWQENRARYLPDVRYRRGRPYTPLVSLEELDRWPATPAERRLLQFELTVRTGGHVHFDPHDFIPVQEASLAAWLPLARNASGAAGSWGLLGRR